MSRADDLARYDEMQRLNVRPAPPEPLDAYYSRHDNDAPTGGAIGVLLLIIIGMILGVPLGATLSAGWRAYDAREASAKIGLNMTPCERCHVQAARAPLDTYAAYTRFHRDHPKFKPSSHPADLDLLAELVRP